MTGAMGDDGETVHWERTDPGAVEPPLVRRVPYLEVKLEFADLEPTAYDDRFFPDAVPYALDGRERVFYWRSALGDGSDVAPPWQLACATTDALHGFGGLPADVPSLTEERGDGTTVVVDGTIAGESTTARLEAATAPPVRVERASADCVEFTADGRNAVVRAGERRRLECETQRVTPAGDGDATAVTPDVAVRYPGPRELHHPAPDADYRLFPSFGLDVADLPRPLSVPTAAGELDHAALATCVGVDLAERPYAERVLWQAFAYAAFDPHAVTPPRIAQLRTGHLVVRPGGA